MVDLLMNEVSADMRAERMAKLWARYRGALLALVAVIVLGTAGYTIWQHQREVRGGEQLARLIQAQDLLTQGKSLAAGEIFGEVAAQTKGDTHELARVWQARAALASGNRPESITLLKPISTTHSLWGDIACLTLAGLDAKEATCLTSETPSPLMALRHQWAASAQWSQGDGAGATARLNPLIENPTTPESVREQAKTWRDAIAAEKAAQ